MMRLFRKQGETKVRFRAMTESGELVDEIAEIVQTQVIAHKAKASIRNRDTVPLYQHVEEGQPPVWRENLIVETGLAKSPGTDSRYCLEDSLNLFKGIKSGAVEVAGDSKLKNYSLGITVNIAAVIVFIVCGWLAGRGIDSGAVVGGSPGVSEETHGFVDTLEVETAGAEGAENEAESGANGSGGASGGGAGAGVDDSLGAEGPVGPGVDSESGQTDPADIAGP